MHFIIHRVMSADIVTPVVVVSVNLAWAVGLIPVIAAVICSVFGSVYYATLLYDRFTSKPKS